ncbi:MAG: slipin family protein, partial [Cyanobacteria bacterium HKST-UBA06]|nr:slipin family protein [Cyanobacteria bacterium HKST-UBA06]
MDILITGLFSLLLPAGFILFFFILSWVRVLNEYERGVVFRFGRLLDKPVGPGMFLLFAPPLVDKMVKVDLRTMTMDVKPQDVITKDNVSLKVSAVVYYRVVDPLKAITEVEFYDYATSQLAQTTLRSVTGQVDMDTLLIEREQLSNEIQSILDEATHPWGIKVTAVEIKQIDL